MVTWGRISLLALASAALISGCGGGDGEIPADDAEILERRLSEVEGAVAEGNCDNAQESANLLVEQVGDGEESLVPRRVDGEVREALQDAARRLSDLVAEQCQEPIEDPVDEEPEETVDPLPSEDEDPETPPEDEAPPEDEGADDGGDSGGDDQGRGSGNRGGGNQGGGPPGGGTAPPSGGTGAG